MNAPHGVPQFCFRRLTGVLVLALLTLASAAGRAPAVDRNNPARSAKLRSVKRRTNPQPLRPPSNRAEFERFLARARREHRPLRLSLAQLARACRAALRHSRELPSELRHLKGFTWFFGYVIERDQQGVRDIHLLGLRDPSRPPIDIDCLATALRSAYLNRPPYCSLDPHPDERFQKSVVLGVPWNTRWAWVMIEADYNMKMICQGQVDPRIPGLNSWASLLARRVLTRPGTLKPMQNRWWFDRQEVPRTLILDDSGDLALLYANPVLVHTELNRNRPQLTRGPDGKTRGLSAKKDGFGTGATSEDAARFARSFSSHLPQLGRKYPWIGELLGLYRLLDLAVHLRAARALPPDPEYWLRDYKGPYRGPARVKPTLRRTIAAGRWRIPIWGGVKMPLDLDQHHFRKDASAGDLKQRVLEPPVSPVNPGASSTVKRPLAISPARPSPAGRRMVPPSARPATRDAGLASWGRSLQQRLADLEARRVRHNANPPRSGDAAALARYKEEARLGRQETAALMAELARYKARLRQSRR
jgi:hypothetical protein